VRVACWGFCVVGFFGKICVSFFYGVDFVVEIDSFGLLGIGGLRSFEILLFV